MVDTLHQWCPQERETAAHRGGRQFTRYGTVIVPEFGQAEKEKSLKPRP